MIRNGLSEVVLEAIKPVLSSLTARRDEASHIGKVKGWRAIKSLWD
jgi:hypothetical protein